MIPGHRDRRTGAFAEGRSVRAFQGFESQTVRRLAIPNAASSLDTLRSLPANTTSEPSGASGWASTSLASIGSGDCVRVAGRPGGTKCTVVHERALG